MSGTVGPLHNSMVSPARGGNVPKDKGGGVEGRRRPKIPIDAGCAKLPLWHRANLEVETVREIRMASSLRRKVQDRSFRVFTKPQKPARAAHIRSAYIEQSFPIDLSWWAMEDSNLRPHACEACALTS